MPGTAATVGLRERHKHQRREHILEAIRELLRELDARLAITADEDPRKHARRLVGEAAQLFIADAAVFRHIVNNSGRSGSLVQENPIPLLRAALRRGQETGMLRPDLHIDALAGHIAMACGGALRQWASERISAAAFRERVRFAVDVVFAASASDDYAAALHAPLERASRRRAR